MKKEILQLTQGAERLRQGEEYCGGGQISQRVVAPQDTYIDFTLPCIAASSCSSSWSPQDRPPRTLRAGT